MKSSMGYRDAVKLAQEIYDREGFDRKSGIFSKVIRLKHGDGSELQFSYASFRKLDKKGEWMAVFTEHHGMHVYSYDDLEWVVEVRSKVLHHYVFGE